MDLVGKRILLRIYLQSADRTPLTPTYERIVKLARQQHMAGATVLRGIFGFGSRGFVQHSALALVEHVPVIVEIVDDRTNIVSFIEGPLDELMRGGMITLERANVMMYRDRNPTPAQLELGTLLEPLSTMPQLRLRGHMSNEPGVLLRIFVGESDRTEGKSLYEAIVHRAREIGLAGATVLRGAEGFGAHSVVHKSALLEMSTDLPIVIEIVDSEAKMKTLLPYLQTVVKDGMVTMEHVLVLKYHHGAATP